MSARTHLLDLALPLLKNHSFTRQTLRLAASQYLHQTGSSSTSQTDKAEAVEDAKVDSFLNTLLPPSPGAEQVLGEHFAAAGMKAMTSASAVSSGSIQSNAGEGSRSAGNTGSSDELRNLLSERLRFSEELAGEHLVEAYALLQSPSTTSSPLPLSISLPSPELFSNIFHSLRDSFKPFPAYHPPPSSSTSPQLSHEPSTAQSGSGLNIPLPRLNPLPTLSYAYDIADQALHLASTSTSDSASTSINSTGAPGRGGKADLGMMREKDEPGTGWYARRVGLGLIYLHAESHLLRPRNIPSSSGLTPLQSALAQLDTSLSRYRSLQAADSRLQEWEEVAARIVGWGWKSWGGIFRSRGWVR